MTTPRRPDDEIPHDLLDLAAALDDLARAERTLGAESLERMALAAGAPRPRWRFPTQHARERIGWALVAASVLLVLTPFALPPRVATTTGEASLAAAEVEAWLAIDGALGSFDAFDDALASIGVETADLLSTDPASDDAASGLDL